MKRVGFVLKRDKPEAEAIARELIPGLFARGLEVYVSPENQGLSPACKVVSIDQMGGRIDLLIVLGGDGTLLNGGGIIGDRAVPVVGINLGTLGFLVPFQPSEAWAAVEGALDGTSTIEERLRLRVRLHRGDGMSLIERFALNDAVIAQGSTAKLVDLAAMLDGTLITTYRADGLIIATPTGSTAYNLAAGGPILAPGQSSVAITPICPHTLTNRPLVVPAKSKIEVELRGDSRNVMLTIDGQWAYSLTLGDRVEIVEAMTPLRVYRSDKDYFEILRTKLMWGSRAS